jgi:pyridoxamine 5'-phosphate oxidase
MNMNSNNELSEKTVDSDPFTQFNIWYKSHLASGIEIPETVSLGTASTNGHVSVRTVLLKGFSESGFLFFTNYKSKKGDQLLSNPNAALLFYWAESGRQVRIEGITEKVSEKDSEDYFKTRPKESQLSAWASEQSQTIPDRQYLEKRFLFYKTHYNESQIEKPPHWGGFRLIPQWFEFWQNGEFRLHDRITYTRKNNLWIIERLAP